MLKISLFLLFILSLSLVTKADELPYNEEPELSKIQDSHNNEEIYNEENNIDVNTNEKGVYDPLMDEGSSGYPLQKLQSRAHEWVEDLIFLLPKTLVFYDNECIEEMNDMKELLRSYGATIDGPMKDRDVIFTDFSCEDETHEHCKENQKAVAKWLAYTYNIKKMPAVFFQKTYVGSDIEAILEKAIFAYGSLNDLLGTEINGILINCNYDLINAYAKPHNIDSFLKELTFSYEEETTSDKSKGNLAILTYTGTEDLLSILEPLFGHVKDKMNIKIIDMSVDEIYSNFMSESIQLDNKKEIIFRYLYFTESSFTDYGPFAFLNGRPMYIPPVAKIMMELSLQNLMSGEENNGESVNLENEVKKLNDVIADLKASAELNENNSTDVDGNSDISTGDLDNIE